jgi:hypothetical protein
MFAAGEIATAICSIAAADAARRPVSPHWQRLAAGVFAGGHRPDRGRHPDRIVGNRAYRA